MNSKVWAFAAEYMMEQRETLTVDFTCNHKAYAQAINLAGVNIYHANGIDSRIKNGTVVIRIKDVDEVMFESMSGEELLEYYGIDGEYYITHEEILN